MFCIINQSYIWWPSSGRSTQIIFFCFCNIVLLLGSVLINVVVRSLPSWSEYMLICFALLLDQMPCIKLFLFLIFWHAQNMIYKRHACIPVISNWMVVLDECLLWISVRKCDSFLLTYLSCAQFGKVWVVSCLTRYQPN